MALFPAYAGSTAVDENISNCQLLSTQYEVTESLETQLLASDSDEEMKKNTHNTEKSPSVQCNTAVNEFYIDCKFDPGNLRVSTLYYPGRPKYLVHDSASSDPCKVNKRWKRYFSYIVVDSSDAGDIAERSAAYRKLLAETPQNIYLWEAYIDFQGRTCAPAGSPRSWCCCWSCCWL
ncbi:unnamed protein product [Leptidea sinapis]|uniref:Uncharacterized protein n=1 Tax=Leptidea sinapis TaxID=189913 RepID=A0A5E4R520_9NEOP|nr:unnamed protein product [Leptidea sinapis]